MTRIVGWGLFLGVTLYNIIQDNLSRSDTYMREMIFLPMPHIFSWGYRKIPQLKGF